MSHKFRRFAVAIVIGFPAVLAVALVLVCFLFGPGHKRRLRHFVSEMQEHVTADELRTWAGQHIDDAQGARVEVSMPGREAPDVVDLLAGTSYGPPVYLTVETAEAYGEPYVFAVWGGGFGHWGLKIGSPRLQTHDDERSYHVKWDNGVFGYSEQQ